MRKLLLTSTAFILSACTGVSDLPQMDKAAAEREAQTQRVMAINGQLEQEARVNRIYWRIARANAELCGAKVTSRTGLNVIQISTVKVDFREGWQTAVPMGDGVTLTDAIEGSPAWKAGLKRGDIVRRVNENSISADGDGLKTLIRTIRTAAPHDVVVRRGEETVNVRLNADTLCDYPITVKQGDPVNAFADGKGITVTSGLLRFAQSDDEIALVLGHEMAHNTVGHIDSMMGNRLAGALAGAIITAVTGIDVVTPSANAMQLAFSQEFEQEADYVGVYHAARAGYDVSDAANLWRRMAVNAPGAINLQGSMTHPSTATRFIAIEQAAAEIKVKMIRGEKLTPNRK